MPAIHPPMPAELGTPPAAVERTAAAFVEGVYGRGDLFLVDELVAPTFVGTTVGTHERHVGRGGVRGHAAGLRVAFSGLSIEVTGLTGGPDRLRIEWRIRGVHERPYLGVEPAVTVGRPGADPGGRPVATDGVTTLVIEDGVVIAARWDLSGLHDAIGALTARSRDPTWSIERDEAMLPGTD